MQKKGICLSFFYFIATVIFSQIKGTMVIDAICTDGNLIIADSRGCIVDSEKKPIEYFDSLPKINLLINQFPVAFAGSATLGDKFYIEIIDDFNKIESEMKGISQSFVDFRDYLLNIDSTFETSFIGGGYYNNAPYIFHFSSKFKYAGQDAFIAN